MNITSQNVLCITVFAVGLFLAMTSSAGGTLIAPDSDAAKTLESAPQRIAYSSASGAPSDNGSSSR